MEVEIEASLNAALVLKISYNSGFIDFVPDTVKNVFTLSYLYSEKAKYNSLKPDKLIKLYSI